jgi:beta-N-acetylhexosaminidase
VRAAERAPASADTTTTAATAVLGRVMLAFEGERLPGWLRRRLREGPAAGVTLFHHANVRSPAQVRELTDEIRAAALGDLPPLVAADQEGGQLNALGEGTTPFPGNMALGATGDEHLAERVGRAVGRELRALGVTVNYAPCLDVATNPANPALGVRSFGADPDLVGRLGAAFVRGVRSAGVAATAKHFPGGGDAARDTHHGLASLAHAPERFAAVELVPFRAAVEAGADVVMSGHFAAPALTGSPTLPATLSAAVMSRLLRRDLGFHGVSITDALDMGALGQGEALLIEVVAAVRAGVDLLLCAPDRRALRRIEDGLRRAAERGLFEPAGLRRSGDRVTRLRRRLGAVAAPGLEVVGCRDHQALAREVAERAITLVRNEVAILPIEARREGGLRVVAVMPAPRDLTPADTSSTVPAGLAAALRRRFASVREVVTSNPPTDDEIAAVRELAPGHDLVVVGTMNAAAGDGQASFVAALLGGETPVVTVALRTPYDLAAYPAAATHVCTYSILPPSLEALADALVGAIPFRGRLPAAVPGLHAAGHGIVT